MFQNIQIFDRELLLKKRSRASIGKADLLIKYSVNNILERLNYISKEFTTILNLGCKNSYGSELLKNKISSKYLLETDLTMKNSNFTRIIADEELIPFRENQFDLVVSVLNLHLINDLPGCLLQIKNILKPKGIFIACMFGEQNLPELRSSLINTEMSCLGGISPRTIPYITIQQLGSLLQRAGFFSPVIDKDLIKIEYSHPLDLIKDLRNMGETNILINRNKKYVGKHFWKKFYDNYTEKFNNIASFEILNLLAIKD